MNIEKRQAIVGQRQRIGDWEVDTMVGHGLCQANVTLTKRKSRFALLRKVERRTADQVCNPLIDLLQPVSDRLHTHTADNGKEFAEQEKVTKELKADFYFAHPYDALERGTNENMNGLVR